MAVVIYKGSNRRTRMVDMLVSTQTNREARRYNVSVLKVDRNGKNIRRFVAQGM